MAGEVFDAVDVALGDDGVGAAAVVDDEQMGAAAVVVVLSAKGEVLQKQVTTVGGN